MISVIVSTKKSVSELDLFANNIKCSIGVEYELISIENPGTYSLCSAYNIGLENSKFNYLCFVHDDVLFTTENWGKRLISLMENDKGIGLIGVAGTKFKSSYPSAWGQSPFLKKFKRGHIVHKIGTDKEKILEFDDSLIHLDVEDVVCLDGVLLFSKKEVFQSCRFDDKLLTHFHGYDIDISLQVFFQSYRVLVDRGILLVHHSGGNHALENTVANRKIGKKWKSKLPVATKDANLTKFKLHILDALNWYFFITNALMRKLHIK